MLKYAFLMLGLVACTGGDKGDDDDTESGDLIEQTDDSGTTDSGDGGEDLTDADGDGFFAEEDDCNDDDPDTHPDADELCDGIDNDCNGSVDDNPVDAETFYVDGDSDSYGDESVIACTMPEGAVEINGDCDDADPAINPNADEVCDGFDNDCNGTVDDAAVDANTYYTDADSDGFGDAEVLSCTQPAGASEIGGDCDDTDDDINPDARETVADGVDTDCDGNALDAEISDTDGDGTNDWYDDTVVEMDCTNVNAYHTTVDFSGESFWYEATLWSILPVCYQLEADTETMLLVDDAVPDQDVWSAMVTGGYLNTVDVDDDEVTYWGMVFGYIDEDNYSVVYYSEEDEVLGFEQWISGSLNEYEITSGSGLDVYYLANMEVTVYEYSGSPWLEVTMTDLVAGASLPSLNVELDSFWGNLEGQFGAYSEGGESFVTSSTTYREYHSHLIGGGAP